MLGDVAVFDWDNISLGQVRRIGEYVFSQIDEEASQFRCPVSFGPIAPMLGRHKIRSSGRAVP